MGGSERDHAGSRGRLAERGLEAGEVPTAEQIAAVHHELGLDRPLLVRYGEWLGRAVHGDLGESLVTPGQGVGEAIRGAVPATLALAAAATLLVLALSIPPGVLGAISRGRWSQQVVRVGNAGRCVDPRASSSPTCSSTCSPSASICSRSSGRWARKAWCCLR